MIKLKDLLTNGRLTGERLMEQTNAQLADALDARANRTMSLKAQEEMREAARRLRKMGGK